VVVEGTSDDHSGSRRGGDSYVCDEKQAIWMRIAVTDHWHVQHPVMSQSDDCCFLLSPVVAQFSAKVLGSSLNETTYSEQITEESRKTRSVIAIWTSYESKERCGSTCLKQYRRRGSQEA
jgi:hypothetical protein